MAAFATTVEGDTYLKDKLNVSAWDDVTEATRVKALAEATIRIDRLNFKTVTRDLLIAGTPPTEVKNATIELALSLLDGVSPEREFDRLFLVGAGVAGARTTYDRTSQPEHIVAGIPSLLAWAWIKPLLAVNREVRISRVS